jgi:biopolymer transport protein ExbD
MFGDNLSIEQGEDEPVQFTKKAKANTGEKGHIDMTPMVDVVFQLLTFFLLAVKRDTQKPLDVPIVTRSTAVAEAESTFITIKAATGGAKEPTFILGDKRSGEGENITSEKLKAELEQAVASGRMAVIVKAERLVPHGDVLKICRIVASVDGALLHVGVQTKD